MFDADRPITKSDQDRLHRTQFAKYLARCILDHRNTDSLVIGLLGRWGTGKTSLINLMLEELRFAASNMLDAEKPIILNFNPWSYSGQNQLIYSFFRRLSSEMYQADYFENKNKIIHLLELYISFFTHKPVPKSLRPKHSWMMSFLKPAVTHNESYGWESGRDLTQVKAELNELLSQQKHKIIIMIDNISRLYEEEINQVFQIVKSMGDYANTVYVLAMDQDYVIRALQKNHGEDAERFLDKIIQLPFDIPAIAAQDLENILLNRLKYIAGYAPPDSWDASYWADIYYSALKYFFTNNRDITHYVNTLSFGFQHVKEVVNPVDFFAITALLVFEPAVYFGIRDNKDLFTDLAENVYEFDATKLAEDKVRADEIVSRSMTIPAEMIEQLVIRLFPRLRRLYQPEIPYYHSESIARKNKRICSLDVFDIYFRLTIPSGTISNEEMKAILKLTADEEGFALVLLRLNQDDRIIKFLDLLDSVAVHSIATPAIPNVLSALIDSADLFPEGEKNNLSFNTPERLHRIFRQLLLRFEKSHDRFEIFKMSIHKAIKSLYIIIHELREQEREHLENEDTAIPIEHRLFLPEELEQLKQAAIERILYWVKVGRLVEHPKLLGILYAWRDWGDANECRSYVLLMTAEDKGLLAFLGAIFQDAIQEALCTEDNTMNPEWRTRLSIIDHFISVDKLIPHAEQLFAGEQFEQLRDTEQLSILIFLSLVDPEAQKIFPKTTV